MMFRRVRLDESGPGLAPRIGKEIQHSVSELR